MITHIVDNCGATTDYGTIISLKKTDGTQPDQRVFIMNGNAPLKIDWLNDATVQIVVREKSEIFKMEHTVDHIQFVYVGVD